MLYSKFSECDTEFLEQIPAKVEAMDTSLGKICENLAKKYRSLNPNKLTF